MPAEASMPRRSNLILNGCGHRRLVHASCAISPTSLQEQMRPRMAQYQPFSRRVTTFFLRLFVDQINRLRVAAREQSLQRGEDVSVAQLVREYVDDGLDAHESSRRENPDPDKAA